MANGRQPIRQQDLYLLVEGVVESLISNQATFTAHDVTQQLRTDHPQTEIVHDDVRAAVRQAMEAPLLTGGYASESRAVGNGAQAIHYYSITQPVPPTVASTLATPSTTDGTSWGLPN
jgi:hypothetical protein